MITDGCIRHPFVNVLDGLKDNEFLQISWRTIVGSDYTLSFKEGDNQQVRVDGEKMTHVDHEGDSCDLWLIVPILVEQRQT